MSETNLKVKEEQLVQLSGKKGKAKILQMAAGLTHQSSDGVIKHDDIIGKEWGSIVSSHLGKNFVILQPALDDLIRTVERNTQTLYPKDIAYIILSLGIGPGDSIVEIGGGSGAMTIALAHSVGREGKVISYERRPEMQAVAQRNVKKLGMEQQVVFKLRDVKEGIDEENLRTIFVDLPNPEDYLEQIKSSLQAGGFFACILPTSNQVSTLLLALKKTGFSFFEVSEILHRYYKPIARRLRPADRMAAHTGYLVFARNVSDGVLD